MVGRIKKRNACALIDFRLPLRFIIGPANTRKELTIARANAFTGLAPGHEVILFDVKAGLC